MMLGILCFKREKKAPTIAHAIFLAGAILIGCGGGGGGGSSDTGVTGATTGSTASTTATTSTAGTTSTTSSNGSTTATTAGTTGSTPFTFFFGSDPGGSQVGLQISSDGTGRTAINTAGNAVTFITANRQGTKLAFVKWDTYKHIFVVNPNGSGLVQLTIDDWDTGWPSFSPDGTKILYTSYEAGTPQLWTMNVNGTGKAALTNLPNGALQGRYSPNGQKIVFVSSSTNDDVWIMNANGTGALALAATGVDENEPAFNADGSKIVFVKAVDNSGEMVGQIHSINATGGTPTRLTTTLLDDHEPVVSLDGLTILFTRPFGPGREVYKMSLTGTDQIKITSESAWAVSPSTGN